MRKLIFIYNANSGLGNLILDGAHKLMSPGTYECKLCKLTFGVLTENSIWKKFRKSADFEMEFLHKDEFERLYASKFGSKFTFPIVLLEANMRLEVFVNTEEIDSLHDVESLIRLIKERQELP
ncbi:GTPase [Maribacter algicola]|uniref:GTPase n=1 Tax=Meishania litoralis TaxID=3434685 RepID=A0ACC7LMY1_9FLAO